MAYRMVVGLGNPGPEYERTRHNAGFLVIERLAEELGARYWKSECGAAVAHVKHGGEELLLVKPQSYMNTSGGPVSKLAAAHGIAPRDVLVIHDDMDIEPGCIRVKVGGGHGGHNGLKSLNAKLAGNEYTRVRVGLGHPPGRKPGADFVLQVPRGADAEAYQQALDLAFLAVRCVLDDGATAAMNRYN